MGRGRRSYDAAFKAEAIQLAGRIGFAEAGKRLSVDSTTIRSWTLRAGIDPAAIENRSHVNRQRARRVVNEEQEQRRREVIESRLDTLLTLQGLALARAHNILAKPDTDWTKKDLAALGSILSKATHDFQLLSGKATERSHDNDETTQALKAAFVLALVDAGLDEETQQAVRAAFAHRIRMMTTGEMPEYGGELDDDERDDEERVELLELGAGDFDEADDGPEA